MTKNIKPLRNIYFYLLLLSWFIFLIFAVSIKQTSLIMNMPYLEARKIILADGWRPVISKTPEEVMGFHALNFRELGYMEVDACSGTGKGYCSFYFQMMKVNIFE